MGSSNQVTVYPCENCGISQQNLGFQDKQYKKQKKQGRKQGKKQDKTQDFDQLILFDSSTSSQTSLQKKNNIGLTNEGNTCFINCSMQCLCNIRELAEYYLNVQRKSTNSLQKEIIKLMRTMWGKQKEQVYDMKFFCKELYKSFEYYRNNKNNQMDSPEFIQNILNFMYEKEQSKKDNKGKIKEIFEGQFHTIITCKRQIFLNLSYEWYECDSVTIDINERFLTIPLTIIQEKKIRQYKVFSERPKRRSNAHPYAKDEHSIQKKPIQLTSCLAAFSKQIDLNGQNMWLCKKCNTETKSQKKMVVDKVGNIVIIQLLRFINDQKVDLVIEYPLVLYQWQLMQIEGPDLFDLIGVICHNGSTIQGGHYISFTVDQQTGIWYKQSDSYVRKVKNQSQYLNNQNAYVLFYKRKV